MHAEGRKGAFIGWWGHLKGRKAATTVPWAVPRCLGARAALQGGAAPAVESGPAWWCTHSLPPACPPGKAVRSNGGRRSELAAGLRRHLSSEVGLLLFDALAQHVARKAADLRAGQGAEGQPR